MLQKESVNVLLIDDDKNFYELIKANINKYNMPIIFNYSEDLPPDDDLEKYDLFLIDNMFRGKPMAIDIVKHLHDKIVGADIIVISGYGDMKFLKKLINIGVTGYIDKDDIEYEHLHALLQDSLDRKKIVRRVRAKIMNFK